MELNYQEVLDRSYVPQMLMTFVGVLTGIGAKALAGNLNAWSFTSLVDLFMGNPFQQLAAFLLFIVSVLSLLAAGWIGIGVLSSRWGELDPGDRVVRVGVLVLLGFCLLLIIYTIVQFLFIAVLAALVSALVVQGMNLSRKRYVRSR